MPRAFWTPVCTCYYRTTFLQLLKISISDPLKAKKRNLQLFEDEINAWLKEQPEIQVIRVEQSASGGSFGPSLWMISIWYDPK